MPCTSKAPIIPNPPKPVDWKRALKKLADAIDVDCLKGRASFCVDGICPASEICMMDVNSDENRCRRMLTKWARENF